MAKPKWTFDSMKIYLSDDTGKEVILNSADLTDYTVTDIVEDIEQYVEGMGGELIKWEYLRENLL